MTSLEDTVGSDQELAEELLLHRFTVMAHQVSSLRWSFVVVITIIAGMAWSTVPRPLIVLWFSVGLLIFALRARWLLRYTVDQTKTVSEKVRGAVAWNVALGAMFGASACFMLWLDRGMASVLTTIVVSTASVALAISGPLLSVYMAYTLGILCPYALVWAMSGGVIGVGLALLMGLFVAVQFRFAQKVSDMFAESFLIRRRNEELVQALVTARDQADSASRAKTRFLAAASHDLRQPLHALSLQSSALLLDPRADDTPMIAAAIAESVEDVSSLLDSLLDISKLDAGTLAVHRRAIQLSRMVDTLARSFGLLVESKGLRFELQNEANQIVDTDPVLLERIVRNLIDNAIKFTPRGYIGMRVENAQTHVALTIFDSGVGIAAEQQDKVFDEFYQVDHPGEAQTRGLGLGLSIVSRLAHMLGIGLQLTSEVGNGTSIRLLLPVSDIAAVSHRKAARTDARSNAQLHGLKVVLLDDEPAIRLGMATLLTRLGCVTASAATVDQAKALLGSFQPDVLLSDYRLQNGANGISAIQGCRAMRPDLKALLISGDTAPDRLREASMSGLKLLHKPVSLEQLKSALFEIQQGGH